MLRQSLLWRRFVQQTDRWIFFTARIIISISKIIEVSWTILLFWLDYAHWWTEYFAFVIISANQPRCVSLWKWFNNENGTANVDWLVLSFHTLTGKVNNMFTYLHFLDSYINQEFIQNSITHFIVIFMVKTLVEKL